MYLSFEMATSNGVESRIFENIVVGAGKPPIGQVTVAYKFARGSYKQAGNIFTQVIALAPDNRTFGIYYDDPKAVPEDKLRYIVGTIISEGDQKIDTEIREKFLRNDYKVTHFPEVSNAVKTQFPFNTMISVFIAISRVYPALGQYIQENRLCAHPMLEIYDCNTIHFMAPLAKQDEFYVPETGQGKEAEGEDESQSQPEGEIKLEGQQEAVKGQPIAEKVEAVIAPKDSKITDEPQMCKKNIDEQSKGSTSENVNIIQDPAVTSDGDGVKGDMSEVKCEGSITPGSTASSSSFEEVDPEELKKDIEKVQKSE
ncbi:unnamed protein product [Owenia fusiformis]|uniref:Uncharacterized protein n=1 Tax=Owenia fusiformis TaxID=6347 RepID=A0A8S4NWS4_OWEFU|nr:unnamed protein product [Owenia fusiformis]